MMRKYRFLAIVLVLIASALVFSSCEEPCEHEYETTSMGAACDHEVTNSKICSKCGDASYTILAPKGHSFTENTVIPTCENGGYTEYTCLCGFSYKGNISSANGHDFRILVTEPTCDEVGFSTLICRICDFTYITDYKDPSGHILNEEKTAATCTKEGYSVYSCDICDYSYTADYKKPTGHVLDTGTVTDPTCTQYGFTTYKCDNCDYSYDSDFVEPSGHILSATVISDVTCTAKGETKHECTCGYSYTEIVSPSGHDFTKSVVAPTVSDMGYTDFVCLCGFSYRGNYRFYSDILDDAYADGTDVVAMGIDISSWNHQEDSSGNYLPIDWVALKEAGVDYVILKAGSTVRENGTLGGVDPTFEMDYEGAKAAGLDVGVYFFTYSTNVSQILADAETLLDIIDGKQFEYPIYLDIEDVEKEDYFPSKIASPILTEMCLSFFSALQREGYYTGLYVNNEFLFNILQTENMIDLFEIWYARYQNLDPYDWTVESIIPFIYAENAFGMWQYSMSGRIPSIKGSVDFNYAYKDLPKIIKDNGFNGFDIPDEEIAEESASTENNEETE